MNLPGAQSIFTIKFWPVLKMFLIIHILPAPAIEPFFRELIQQAPEEAIPKGTMGLKFKSNLSI